MGTRLSRPSVVAPLLLLLFLAATPPATADAYDLTLDERAVDVGTALSGTVVDGPSDDGNRIFVSLDANGDGVYDNGEPQVRISSEDDGTAHPWAGLETDGLTAGSYTVYAVEAKNVKSKDILTGATAAVSIVDPHPTISNFEVSNPSGGDVLVEFDSSEPLSAIAVFIAGAETGTLTTSDFTESGSGPYSYSATYVVGTVGSYTATIDDAIDAGGNDGAAGESGSVYVSFDSTPPDLQAAETADADTDGTVDEVRVMFTEPIDDDVLSTSDVTVAGATVTAVSTGAVVNDDVAVLSVSGLPARDTSLTPQVILRTQSVTDLAGNDGPTGATSIQATDGAPPVILAAKTGDVDDDGRIDRLNATLSEAVLGVSLRAVDFDIEEGTYAGEMIAAYADGDRHVLFGFNEGVVDDTGATPSLIYSQGTTVDVAGNPMANVTFIGTTDGAPPTLDLSTANPTTDGFTILTRLSEAGSTTYVTLDDGAAPPTTVQVLLGRDASDESAIRWGTIQVPVAGMFGSASLNGLPSGGSYDVYAVATDPSGNHRSVPVVTDAATLEPEPDADEVEGSRAKRGTSVRAKLGPGDRVRVEIRNPGTRRPLSTPLGSVGSAGIIYRRMTFNFDTKVNSLSVELVPGEREAGDPAMTDAHVLDYFTARRDGEGPSPFSTVTFEVRVNRTVIPEGSSLDDVAFYRFVDDRWVLIESTHVGELFSFTTGGFSSFAIAVPGSPPVATTTATEPISTASPPISTEGTPVVTMPSTSTPSPEEPLQSARRGGDASLALGIAVVMLLALLVVSRILTRP